MGERAKFVKNFFGGEHFCEIPLYGGKSKFVKNFYGGEQICQIPLYGKRANFWNMVPCRLEYSGKVYGFEEGKLI